MQKMRFQLSLDIVHCDGFVSMPATAQALYVQIVSTCDDEGFTSQIEMCKFLAHASDEDVKTLIDREFIFQVGDRKVTVVRHWKMNTYLHEGKVNPSKFAERMSVFLKPNGNYTLNPEEGKPLEGCISETKRNENGMRTEYLGNTSASRVGQGARARRAGSNPIQSNPIHSITPSNDSVIHTNQSNTIQDTSLHSVSNNPIQDNPTQHMPSQPNPTPNGQMTQDPLEELDIDLDTMWGGTGRNPE